MTDQSPVTFHRGDDPELLAASQRARDTFRLFWKEVAFDFNRIIPAISLACVKAPFCDDFSDPDAAVEHMWVDEINFDGEHVHGVLMNAPNWLLTVRQEDDVEFPLERLGDWLLSYGDEVFGAHTVQLLRSRMAPEERAEYDRMWDIDFPPPDVVNLPEHRSEFEETLATLVAEQIAKEPSTVHYEFGNKRTLLHLESLYGRAASVRVLLENGASTTARCDRGWTPIDYAKALGWTEVIELLEDAA